MCGRMSRLCWRHHQTRLATRAPCIPWTRHTCHLSSFPKRAGHIQCARLGGMCHMLAGSCNTAITHASDTHQGVWSSHFSRLVPCNAQPFKVPVSNGDADVWLTPPCCTQRKLFDVISAHFSEENDRESTLNGAQMMYARSNCNKRGAVCNVCTVHRSQNTPRPARPNTVTVIRWIRSPKGGKAGR